MGQLIKDANVKVGLVGVDKSTEVRLRHSFLTAGVNDPGLLEVASVFRTAR